MDYRQILSKKFEERKRTNQRYSLRSFARDLAISPSRLSDVLAGKGHLSVERAIEIARILNLNPIMKADFIDTAEARGRGAKVIKKAADDRTSARKTATKLRTLSEDELSIMSDWRNLAIWTFMTLPSFDGRRQTIAAHFKMNIIEVDDVLRRLQRLEMISINGDAKTIGSTQAYAGGAFPDAAICAFHRQLSALGKNSIDAQHFDERHLESAFLTINHSHFGEIQQKIANFCRSLVHEYGDQSTNDAVYGLSLQFFRV